MVVGNGGGGRRALLTLQFRPRAQTESPARHRAATFLAEQGGYCLHLTQVLRQGCSVDLGDITLLLRCDIASRPGKGMVVTDSPARPYRSEPRSNGSRVPVDTDPATVQGHGGNDHGMLAGRVHRE